eukprot:c23384_g1_i1 orf=414-1235(+)
MAGFVHPDPFQVVETAAAVADLAWTAIGKHQDRDERHALEDELVQEKLENQRLKLALEECQKTLEGLQRRQEGTVPCEGKLNDASRVQHGLDCPSDLYEQLKQKVDASPFLERLKEFHKNDMGEATGNLVMKDGDDAMVNLNPEDPNWWMWITDGLVSSEQNEELGDLDNDGYIVVSQDDVVDGMAIFIARYISSNPQAKDMTPEELQKAISLSFTKMEARGMIRKLWDISKFLYIAASWSAAAAGIYKNPFLLRAFLRAISASCRLIIKVLM